MGGEIYCPGGRRLIRDQACMVQRKTGVDCGVCDLGHGPFGMAGVATLRLEASGSYFRLRGLMRGEADMPQCSAVAIMIDRIVHASSHHYSSGGRLQAWSLCIAGNRTFDGT